MPCMQEFLQRAKADRPVYINDVRDAFCREGERPRTLLVHLYDNSARRFDLRLPRFATAEERTFGESFLHAMLYNCLSSLGARKIEICFDPADSELAAFVKALDGVFQVHSPKRERTGYRCV